MWGIFLNKSIAISLFLKNGRVRIVFIVYFFLKALLLIAFGFAFDSKGVNSESENLFFFVLILSGFISPLPISVIINNFFGFYKDLWLTIEINTGNYKPILKLYFTIAILLISIDFPTTIIYAFRFSNTPWFICQFYLMLALIIIPLGVISSIHFPKYVVREGFKLGTQSSSQLFGYISYVIGILFMLPLVSPLFYLLYPVTFAIVLIFYTKV